MKSMTGYAYKEARYGGLSLSVEIKGYNSRFLEIFANLPPALSGLGPAVREAAASVINRGKIEIGIRMKDEAAAAVSVNAPLAKAYFEAISALSEALGLGEKPGLSLILGMEGVIETGAAGGQDGAKSGDGDSRQNGGPGRYWAALEPLLAEVLARFDAERAREGKQTEADILAYIAALEASLSRIEANAASIEKAVQDGLRARFAELLGEAFAHDPAIENRALAEIAVLLMKYTIAEELSRLRSHLAEFRLEVGRASTSGSGSAPSASGAGVGKKLDFLCQEINREVNTIGSKTTMLEVSREVVAMKDALENVREQLRNVE
jgi:uncharacterized protein (TIGR00255 family)